MHTVVWMFLRLQKYLYLLWIQAYAPKAVYEQVQDIQKVGWKFPGFGWKKKNNPPPTLTPGTATAVASLSDLHLYHFDGKFHQFALQLPKLTLLKASQELYRVCCYSSKITVTSQTNYFILKYYLWITLYSISFPHRLLAVHIWHPLFPIWLKYSSCRFNL